MTAIVVEALELEGPARERLLDRRCGNDADLRADVLRFLVEDDQDPSSLSAQLDHPRAAFGAIIDGELPLAPEASSGGGDAMPPIPMQIGRYRLREQLGRGTYGVVFRATQERPVRREVAIKVLDVQQPIARMSDVIAEFEAEYETISQLGTHPVVPDFYDAGVTEAGRHWFAMALVRGEPITTYCDQSRLDLDARVRLFADVCDAVSAAHRKAIVHRDLKPANVLVSVENGVACPHIIDFGTAASTVVPVATSGADQMVGRATGTPAYSSPEQAAGRPGAVRETTDVFSLGVMLYELLTGRLPIDAELLKESGSTAIHDVIPEPPSAHRPAIHAELDAIVMKAMEKSPDRRYATAVAMAADLEAHRAGAIVSAHPRTLGYRLQKWVAQRRSGIGLLGVVVAVAAIAYLMPSIRTTLGASAAGAAVAAVLAGGWLLHERVRRIDRERRAALRQVREVSEELASLRERLSKAEIPTRGALRSAATAVLAFAVVIWTVGRPAPVDLDGGASWEAFSAMHAGFMGRGSPSGVPGKAQLRQVLGAIESIVNDSRGRLDEDELWAITFAQLAGAPIISEAMFEAWTATLIEQLEPNRPDVARQIRGLVEPYRGPDGRIDVDDVLEALPSIEGAPDDALDAVRGLLEGA